MDSYMISNLLADKNILKLFKKKEHFEKLPGVVHDN